jgi:FkbM family methyltransferase
LSAAIAQSLRKQLKQLKSAPEFGGGTTGMTSSIIRLLTGKSTAANALRSVTRPARRALRALGIDIVPFTPHHSASPRHSVISTLNLDLVLDVGANAGQYGQFLRASGYTGDILSLEPMQTPYRTLATLAGSDRRWRALNCGAGDVAGDVDINIAGNSYSSSILPMQTSHVEALAESAYIGRERIQVRRIDEIHATEKLAGRRIYMKVDTQGFEDRVIKGSGQALADIAAIEVEASLVSLYEGQATFQALHQQIADLGFYITHIENGFANADSGELLQVDVIYRRRTA